MTHRRLATLATVSFALAAPARPARADLIANGSFAQAFVGWNQPGAPAVQYTIATSTRDGSNAARIQARAQASDAPRQDVRARLLGAGSGVTHTTRLWIDVATPASVRAYLNLTDTQGSRQELIAERVFGTPGTWLEVEGTRAIAWQGTLSSAVVSFEVELIAENLYADFALDDVSIEIDTDGDHLTDLEEQALGTLPGNRDSDGDGLPDGWESRNGLDPFRDDRAADPDGDCFSNHVEYHAATDPADPDRYPGRPSNPALRARGRDVLRYLALRPSNPADRVLSGQHLSYPAPPNDEYASHIDGLYTQTGMYPAVLAMQYDDGANPLQVASVNPYAIAWWNAGGLVEIKWNPRNPWTTAGYNDRTFNGFNEVITPGFAANANYMVWLDEVATGLTELRDAGVVVLWRVCSEMNGGWFWWGRRDRQGYIDFWRHMNDYLNRQRGLDNLLWVYESDSAVHGGCAIDYYYPGDDVIDVLGHNLYSDTWMLPFDAEQLYRPYGKVHAVPQAGPGPLRDGTFDNRTYLDGAPAGAGGVRNQLPRLSYFSAWNTFWTWDPVIGQSVKRSLALVDNVNAAGLLGDPWVVTRDEIDLSCPPAPRVAILRGVKSGSSAHFTWADPPLVCSFEVHADLDPAGAFTVATGAATSGATGVLTPRVGATTYYRVAARNDCELGTLN